MDSFNLVIAQLPSRTQARSCFQYARPLGTIIMNKRSGLIIIIFLSMYSISTSCKDYLEDLGNESQLKRDISSIKSEFKGIVIKTYSTREGVEPTHLKIQTKDSILKIVPYNIDIVTIGDSIIKPKSENIFIIKKPDSTIFKQYFVRISKKERLHPNFPSEWRDKWMESSAWDTLTRK